MANRFTYPFEKKPPSQSTEEWYAGLTEYQKYQLSFHPERPKFLDYLSLFTNPQPCFESPAHGAALIQTFRAELALDAKAIPVMLIGQQTGPTSEYAELMKVMKSHDFLHTWNHGMPTPASYVRALQAIRAADGEGRMILCFVDTPGADPTEESEAGGIAWRIGETIQRLIEARVPTLAVIMNRGCSGGAIALTGCDRVLAMEYSTYLVISPEAASSILFRTRAQANDAAAASRVTSREGYALGIVDEIIPEPEGPAHRNHDGARAALRSALRRHCLELAGSSAEQLHALRVRRWAAVGSWSTLAEEEVLSMQRRVSRLPMHNGGMFIKRHPECRTIEGERVYDPVFYPALREQNFVCKTCGYRYARPSVWDTIDLLFEPGSFREHPETRTLVDRDILEFPGYAEKLRKAREETGLPAAMITGDAVLMGRPVIFAGTDFGFLGGSFCMSTGEKLWRAAERALQLKIPMVLVASGGGARMHEGCSSMVSIPKVHLALSRVEGAGIPIVTIITDPTLGGVAIGYGARGIRLFEHNAGNIGFSGKRVIEQYTGTRTSRDFQTTSWLMRLGHARHSSGPATIREEILRLLDGNTPPQSAQC